MPYSGESGVTDAQLTEIVAAIGGYIAGNCDFARPYLDAQLSDAAIAQLPDNVLRETVVLALIFYRAVCDYQAGDMTEAVSGFQAVLDYAWPPTEDPSAFWTDSSATNLAWLYAQQGDADSALALMDSRRVATYDGVPRGDGLNNLLVRIALYAELGAADIALSEYNALLTLLQEQPSPSARALARVYAERGYFYAGQGDRDQALDDYDEALALWEDYPKPHYYIALLLETTGDFVTARARYAVFLGLVDADPLSRWAEYDADPAPLIAQARAAVD